MKYFMFSFFIFMLSCSLKSPDQDKKNKSVQNYEEINPEDLSKMDTDGDRINDLDEKNKGLSPFVADIPEMRTRFLQKLFNQSELACQNP